MVLVAYYLPNNCAKVYISLTLVDKRIHVYFYLQVNSLNNNLLTTCDFEFQCPVHYCLNLQQNRKRMRDDLTEASCQWRHCPAILCLERRDDDYKRRLNRHSHELLELRAPHQKIWKQMQSGVEFIYCFAPYAYLLHLAPIFWTGKKLLKSWAYSANSLAQGVNKFMKLTPVWYSSEISLQRKVYYIFVSYKFFYPIHNYGKGYSVFINTFSQLLTE